MITVSVSGERDMQCADVGATSVQVGAAVKIHADDALDEASLAGRLRGIQKILARSVGERLAAFRGRAPS